jgi:hypothetical protein
MSQTSNIPVIYIIGFVSFVVVSSVLVGVLPVYVNRPICEKDISSNLLKTIHKRDIIESEYIKKLEICPDFNSPIPGITFPWMYPYLPTNFRPLNYDLTIDFEKYSQNAYEGVASVSIELSDSTDTFIIHKKFINVEVIELKDKNGNLIEISCYGEYEKNDYYIFKTKILVQIDSSPLQINYRFNGSLDKYQNGLFQYQFDNVLNKSLIVSKFEPIEARKAL